MGSHCGVIPIGKKIGNVTIYCPNISSGEHNVTYDRTIELILELYVISVVCFVGIFGNLVSIAVLRRDQERREAMLLLQVNYDYLLKSQQRLNTLCLL